MFIQISPGSQNNLGTFVTKFVTKNFHKSPNLVTLFLSKIFKKSPEIVFYYKIVSSRVWND